MRKTEKIKYKFFYLFEPAYSIIYYSFVLTILCISIIISLEQTKVVMLSVILGVIFCIFLCLPMLNRIYVQDVGLWVHSWLRKDFGIYYHEIDNYRVEGHKIYIYYQKNKEFIAYMKADELQKLVTILAQMDQQGA